VRPVFSEEAFAALTSNALLFAAFCLLHSLLARSGLKRRLEDFIAPRYYRLVYVLFSVLSLLAVMLLWQPMDGFLWQSSAWIYAVMTVLSLTAFLGGLYCVAIMRPFDFLGLSSLGRKERQPLAPPRLSTAGPYAHCRHPMYLCFLLAGFLRPEMSYGDFEFLLIALFYVILAIPFEERNLKEELGEAYLLYQENVPALLPRLRPWRQRPWKERAR